MKEITLADAAYISFAFRNDLHWLHHHISGPNFLDLHEMLGEYYDKALEDFDYFSEHAIANHEKLVNVNGVDKTDAFKMWEPVSIEKDVIHEDELQVELNRIGTDYLEALDLLRPNCPNFIQSDLDAIHSFWDTEINYKNEQRGK